MKRIPPIFLIGVSGLFSMEAGAADRVSDGKPWDEVADWDGQELSRTYCVNCHLYPEPNALPRESWPYVLDLMGLYFGYDDGEMLASIVDEQTRADLFDVGKYPEEPTLTPFQWAAIRDFYESSQGSGPVEAPPVGETLLLFEPSLVYGDDAAPVTSLVQVASGAIGFFLGDAKGYRLIGYDAKGREVSREELPGAIVQLEIGEGIERATIVGRMHPSNSATGSILERAAGQETWRTLVDDLHRPVRSLAYDFDRDGRTEIFVNEYGHYSGAVSLFSPNGNGSSNRTVLRSEAGSISSETLFPDGPDGEADLLVLNAQAREDITLYRHLEGLEFEARALLVKPPSFGYTQMRLVDLTGDDKAELVTVNGDNADLPGPPQKPYHGIRIYDIRPGPELEEIAFLFAPGAFQASFDDFDGDGRTDIAVASFFPDPRRPEQGFALFENEGDLRFTRRSMPEGSLAPWMTIDSGDIDGDGDIDIVLGSGYVKEASVVDESVRRPAAMILRNRRISNAELISTSNGAEATIR